MPKPETEPWLKSAIEDEAAFNALKEIKLLGIAAYHAQQAAEKLAKAALIESGVLPSKIHDIRVLVAAHPNYVNDLVLEEAAGRLNSFATLFRYPAPGNSNEPTFKLIL